MKNIILQPDECWQYFKDNKELLKQEIHMIAEEPNFGIAIYLANDSELPYVAVYVDDDMVDSCFALDEQDLTYTVDEFYKKYIEDSFQTLLRVSEEDEDEEESFDDFDMDLEFDDFYPSWTNEKEEESESSTEDDLINDREEEINVSLENFLETVCEKSIVFAFKPDEIDEIKDHFCEYLARKYKLEIWRPMYLEDENGKDFYTEYPYEHMIYDDPENPIYA